MNNDLISREALKKEMNKKALDLASGGMIFIDNINMIIDNAPTVEISQGEFIHKYLESWLYQIAMNNIGTDFEKSVVEIIHRLDGFERFVSEQKGGAE